MSDIFTAIGEAARWLRECHDWMLANDLDGGCRMTANPLDLAEGLEALTPATAPDREAIARIIDPAPFEPAIDFSDDDMNARHADALTKADAILSLRGEG